MRQCGTQGCKAGSAPGQQVEAGAGHRAGRARVGHAVGVVRWQLGGHAVYLDPLDVLPGQRACLQRSQGLTTVQAACLMAACLLQHA